MYSDYFALENAARDYRGEWQAWAERERRLALLERSASPAATLRDRLRALRAALAWRPADLSSAGRDRATRPARERAGASLALGPGNE